VWDAPESNPWATIPVAALIELGHTARPDPGTPGMFALADRGRLRELLEDAGFVEVSIEPIASPRSFASATDYIDETVDLSFMFAGTFNALPGRDQLQVRDAILQRLAPFTAEDESIELPAVALGAAAEA
jgi:hypothetical protein